MAINDAGMFTVKEINRLKILQDVIDRNIRPGQAAEMLGITPRHCSRLLKRYRQYGPLGMNNQSRGRTGNRLLPASLTDQALSIIREGTVAKLAMRQPFVLFKGLTFQKLCLPGAFRPGDHHNKMLRPGLCVVHASPQYL